jgi:hypothetical protein
MTKKTGIKNDAGTIQGGNLGGCLALSPENGINKGILKEDCAKLMKDFLKIKDDGMGK